MWGAPLCGGQQPGHNLRPSRGGSCVGAGAVARVSAACVQAAMVPEAPFSLSVPVAGMEATVLAVGSCHGTVVDKLAPGALPGLTPIRLPPAAFTSTSKVVQVAASPFYDGSPSEDGRGAVDPGVPFAAGSAAFVLCTVTHVEEVEGHRLCRCKVQGALVQVRWPHSGGDGGVLSPLLTALESLHCFVAVSLCLPHPPPLPPPTTPPTTPPPLQPNYWTEGKLFAPVSPDVPPYLTFFGSQRFGYVVCSPPPTVTATSRAGDAAVVVLAAGGPAWAGAGAGAGAGIIPAATAVCDGSAEPVSASAPAPATAPLDCTEDGTKRLRCD
jgi:hypothetical protein